MEQQCYAVKMQALDNAQVQAGKRVLIHGGSGGVGGVAVQLAKARGAHVTSTCSTKNIQLVKVHSSCHTREIYCQLDGSFTQCQRVV